MILSGLGFGEFKPLLELALAGEFGELDDDEEKELRKSIDDEKAAQKAHTKEDGCS